MPTAKKVEKKTDKKSATKTPQAKSPTSTKKPQPKK